MTAICVNPIKGRVIRLVKLDTCGNPVTGASSAVVVAQGFVSVAQTFNYEDGTEYTQKRADGSLCVADKDPSQLLRIGLEIVMCTMDPDALVLMGGARLLSTSATGTGGVITSDVNTSRFSLETWQNVAAGANCNPSGIQQYLYWAWPNVGNGIWGDYTVENGVSTFTLSAETQVVGSQWGDGPGATSWLPTSLSPTTNDHAAYNVTTTAPPSPSCGATTLS
jgi:hypothetical protein